jgi:CubicO group peptidase (beta-lactamase class C family)
MLAWTKFYRNAAALLAMVLFTAGLGMPCMAVAAASPTRQMTSADLEAYVDGIVEFGMTKGDIAGGVVTVVRDGKIFFSKGYGKADVARRIAVDPERTLFRVGSISKTFTAIAAMQLVERGKLALDVDIQRYLDFQLPKEKFSAPITLRHLLTHSAGFEDTYRHIFIEDPNRYISLASYMRQNIPTRMNPPGKVIAYSNYGSSMVGYIVQRVSGVPYDRYIQENILAPLAMNNSTASQPVKAALRSAVSQGYLLASGQPGRYEFVGPAPAGSVSATGVDMGRYMISLLAMGNGDQPSLLSSNGHEEMFKTQKTAHPKLWGIGLTFLVEPEHGQRIVWHNGGTSYFLSNMHLMLDQNIGVFSSFNTSGNKLSADSINVQLWDGFLDRYFPVADPVLPKPLATAREHAALMAGDYLSTRRPETSFAAALNLLGSVPLTANNDGTITFLAGHAGDPWKWQEIEPFVWQHVGGVEKLFGERGPDGQITGLSYEFSHLDRVRGISNPAIALPIAVGSLAVLIVGLLVWSKNGITGLIQRNAGSGSNVADALLPVAMPWRAAKWLIAIGIISLFGFLFVGQGIGDAAGQALANTSGLIPVLRAGTVMIMLGGGLALVHAFNMCRTPQIRFSNRLSSTTIALAALALSMVLWRYQVFGFSDHY